MALSHCLCSAGLSVLLLGCADPQFAGEAGDAANPPMLDPFGRAEEAGTPGNVDGGAPTNVDGGIAILADGGTADAAVAVAPLPGSSPNLPAWAGDLVGRYGYRTRLFVQAGSVVARSDALGFATISRALDGSLVMEVTNCEAITQSSLATMRVTYPELLPVRHYRLGFDGAQFHASLIKPVAAGFLAEPPESCRGKEGMRVDKDPSQLWIRGTLCTCPTNVDAVVESSDCRVRDTDGDGAAGFRLEGSGAASGVYGGAIAFKHDFIMGTRYADGSLLAFNDDRSVNYQLTGSGTWTTSRVCPPLQNATNFAPVAAEERCAGLLAKRGTLFPTAPPEAPERCF
jgi:hypothetical protein